MRQQVHGLIAGLVVVLLCRTAMAQPAAIDPAALGSKMSSSGGSGPKSGSSGTLAALDLEVVPFEHILPAGLDAPERQALWRRGVALEEGDRFLEAAALYQALSEIAPERAFPYWKVARNLWRHAEALPVDAKEERLAHFGRAQGWAARGLAIERDCAECMLWKFAAMGRIGTTQGVFRSLGSAPEMRDLLERGIELRPTYADAHYNTTLGNLYYAAAVFYRVVPDWRWLDWVFGVKGNLDRSLEMIRHALQISPMRVDYNVEMGAILACYGEREGASWASAESQVVLRRSGRLPVVMDQDPLDMEHAQTLLDQPGKACGYSRDGWIDFEREQRQAGRR